MRASVRRGRASCRNSPGRHVEGTARIRYGREEQWERAWEHSERLGDAAEQADLAAERLDIDRYAVGDVRE